jgi:hypothetical protein
VVTKKSKREKRSPIKAPPLRLPGQSLQRQLLDVLLDQWMPWCMLPVLLGVAAGVEWVRLWISYNPTQVSAITLTVLAVIAAIISVYKIRQLIPVIRSLKQGMEGERVVGQFLEEYCRERGYKVFHDVLGDGFNVDHVLIGKGGIFTINTKTISKPEVGEPVVVYDGESVSVGGHKPDRDPVAQAKGEARFIREMLAESTNRRAQNIPVRPVVLYPGWFIEGSSSGREVWVLNPKVMISFLDHENAQLASEDVALFASRLGGRVRERARQDLAEA